MIPLIPDLNLLVRLVAYPKIWAMFSQQYQVPAWELQLQGLIARNSANREASLTTASCDFPKPHPHPNQQRDIPNTVSPTNAQLKSTSRDANKQPRTDRALSLVNEEIKKQGNVLDIVRGQIAAFSSEFSSNRLVAESIDAKMSSHGRLLKRLQSEENSAKMRLKAAASEITILQREQSETKELTASLFRQMQQELSDLKANVQILRDDNALMKEQLDAVGVTTNEQSGSSGAQPLPSSSSVTLNDRIKAIVAAEVAIHSSEIERATAQSIQEFESGDQSAVISRDMDALEQRVTSAMNNALEIVENELAQAKVKGNPKESGELAQLAKDLQNDLSERMDCLYVRREEVQNMIAKEKASERLCRAEMRQKILEEQMYEQSSATISADPLCSTHGKNDLLFGDTERNLAEEISCESMSDSSAGIAPLSTIGTPHQFDIGNNDQTPITSRSHEKRASQEEGTIHQAPEWLHGAVIEELKDKFSHEKDHRDVTN